MIKQFKKNNNKKNKARLYLLARMVARWAMETDSGGAGEAVRLAGELKGELG